MRGFLPLIALLTVAARPQPLGTLTLDLAAPVIDATIDGQPVRLRVDPAAKDVVQLNPAAAARIGIALPQRLEAVVGRTDLAGRAGPGELVIAGRTVPVIVAAHNRDCCTGVDGEIAPLLLPYDAVAFVAARPIAGAVERRYPLQASGETGQFVRVRTAGGTVLVQVSLAQPATLATAASGAMLAKAGGGRFVGDALTVAPAFGIARPARMVELARPVTVAGFAIDRVAVRQADFRGFNRLPSDREAGDIEVRGRAPPAQSGWPVLLIGRDRLAACDRIVMTRAPVAELTLRCAP